MIHPNEAAAIQKEVARAFGDPVGVRDATALEQALARPFSEQNGIPRYPTYFNKVSALLQGILMSKPFSGANRRTAVCIAALLLEERGYRFAPRPDALAKMVPAIELGFASWHRISVWIKANTRRNRAGATGERS